MGSLRKVWIVATAALLLAACSGPAAPSTKTSGTLTVCSYAEFTPVSYGEGQGYEPDLLRAIADSWGLDIAFKPIETYEGIWLLPSDATLGCDVATGGITPTQERKDQGAVFSPTTASFAQSLLVRKGDFDSGKITDYSSFAGTSMVIGVVPGTTGESYARQRAQEAGLPMSALRQYPSEAELLPALRSGEIDAIARGEIGNRYQQSLDPTLVTIALRDFGEGFAISVDPANQELQSALADGIDTVTKGGTIGYQQWAENPQVFSAD